LKNKNYEERTWGMDLEYPDLSKSTTTKTVSNKNPIKRKLTNDDLTKYEPMVEKYIRDSVIKNWNEAQLGKNSGDTALGNTGLSLNDIRQHFRTEVCVALQNYNPDYRTKEGKSVKESTFVFNHLRFRVGQMMKRLTKKRYGYGIWQSQIEQVLWEVDND
jgi:hypothetical protein